MHFWMRFRGDILPPAKEELTATHRFICGDRTSICVVVTKQLPAETSV